jgi:hypothetical protein
VSCWVNYTEEFEEKSEGGRRRMKNADLNKLACTELILSVDASNKKNCTWNLKNLQDK